MRITNTTKPICKNCTNGGYCQNGITVSRGNYYGFKTNNSNNIEYIPCPALYCCSSETKQCSSYDTCNTNRVGHICGRCKTGYYEDFFHQGCVKKGHCKQQLLFWGIYIATAVVLMLVLCFLDDVKDALMYLYTKLFTKLDPIPKEHSTRKAVYVCEDSEIKLSRCDDIRKSQSKENQVQPKVIISSPHTIHQQTLVNNKTHSKIKKQKIAPDAPAYTTIGVINALLSYYQIKSLINIDIGTMGKKDTPTVLEKITTVPTTVFNLQVFLLNIQSTLCPTEYLTATTKHFLKDCLLTVVSLFFTFICILLAATRRTTKTDGPMCLLQKFELGYLRIITFGYKNISNFALLVVNCVMIDNQYVLYIDGTRTCLQWWQYADFAFITLWVLPFPWALYLSYTLYRDRSISCRQMLASLTFPPCLLFIYIYTKCSSLKAQNNIIHHGVQFERISEMFEEPYRLKQHSTDSRTVFWEHWRLICRLVLSIITTMIVSPLYRVCSICPVVLVFMIVYFKVKPFKKHLVLLHWLEMMSLVGFCYLLVYNVLKAYLYVYNLTNIGLSIDVVMTFFDSTQIMLSPVIALIVYFVFMPIVSLITNRRKTYKLR